MLDLTSLVKWAAPRGQKFELKRGRRRAAMASRQASKDAKGAGNGEGAGAQVVSCTTQALIDPVWQTASLALMVAAVESVLG